MKRNNFLLGAICLSFASLAFFACENDAEKEFSADKKNNVEQIPFSNKTTNVVDEDMPELVHFKVSQPGDGGVVILRLTFGKPWKVCRYPSWKICRVEFFPKNLWEPLDHYFEGTRQIATDIALNETVDEVLKQDTLQIPLLIEESELDLSFYPYWVDPATEFFVQNVRFKAVGGYKLFDPSLGDKGGYMLSFVRQ